MKRVLFIDDDYATQKIIGIIFGSQDIVVDECYAPTAAPILIEKNGYDAIFVDYKLPIMNGVDLIKKMQSKIHCPVYVVSSMENDFIEDKVKSAGVNVNGIISKNGFRKNLEAVINLLYGRRS